VVHGRRAGDGRPRYTESRTPPQNVAYSFGRRLSRFGFGVDQRRRGDRNLRKLLTVEGDLGVLAGVDGDNDDDRARHLSPRVGLIGGQLTMTGT